jgi:hypothetical protein
MKFSALYAEINIVSSSFNSIEEISIFSNSSHLERRAGLLDTILKGTHPWTIPARFSVIWFSGFRGEDFFLISSPLFLICIMGQNRQKFKVHKKFRNIC